MSNAKTKKTVHPGLYDVILSPVITEKSTSAISSNKVTFKVRTDAAKTDVRNAVEQIFGVTVVSVNTVLTKGKVKRFRGVAGKRSDVKKAIVTLKQGDYIDFSVKV